MGITGLPILTLFELALLGFTGFYLVLLGFTGFFLVLLSFTGFYWVILGHNGFYWVLLCSNCSFNKYLSISINLIGLKRDSFSLTWFSSDPRVVFGRTGSGLSSNHKDKKTAADWWKRDQQPIRSQRSELTFQFPIKEAPGGP